MADAKYRVVKDCPLKVLAGRLAMTQLPKGKEFFFIYFSSFKIRYPRQGYRVSLTFVVQLLNVSTNLALSQIMASSCFSIPSGNKENNRQMLHTNTTVSSSPLN